MELLLAMGIAAALAIAAYRLPAAAQRVLARTNKHRLARRGIQSLDAGSFHHARPAKAPAGGRLVDRAHGEAGLRRRARQALRRAQSFGCDPGSTGVVSAHDREVPASARAAGVPPIGAG